MNNATLGSKKSLWSATAESAIDCPQLKESHDTNVVVIGAGFTGLSTALHLAKEGIDVTILEANTVGFGGSGRNGGQVNPGWKLLPEEILEKYGSKRGKQVLQMVSGTCDYTFDLIEKYQIKCAPRRAPYLRAAIKKRGIAEVKDWAEQWGKYGISVEYIDKASTHELMGSKFFDGGFTDPRGGSLQPLSYVRGLARSALGAGVKIFTQSTANEIVYKDPDWIVTTEYGRIKAEHLVIATNGYTNNLWPRLEKQVVPVASLLTATKPLPEDIKNSILPEGHHVSDTRRRMMYFKVDETGRFVIGGRGQALTPTKQYDDTQHLQREAQMLYPQLRGIEWEYNWGGLVAMTKSHTPLLIKLGTKAYAGLGYNGRGVAMGTMMGRLLAETVLGAECVLEPQPLSGYKLHAFRNIGIFLNMTTAGWLDQMDR